MRAPELAKVEEFRIVDFDFDPGENVAHFDYAFDDSHEFRETVEFGGPSLKTTSPGFERALRLVHLAAGVSYFKAAAPSHIVVETGSLSLAEEGLVHDLYDKGLREFAVANDLAVPIQFTLEVKDVPRAVRPASYDGPGHLPAGEADSPPRGIAVPIGGGKDSIVLVDALKSTCPQGVPVSLVAVNKNPAMERIADVAGLPLVSIKRTISPNLLRLNSAGALNGHVPITAIVSLIAVAAGYIYGYDTTLMALERSADEVTALVGEVPVNHQWSKSTECELELRHVIRDAEAMQAEDRAEHRPLEPAHEQLAEFRVLAVAVVEPAYVRRPPPDAAEADVEAGPDLLAEGLKRRPDVARPDGCAVTLATRPGRAAQKHGVGFAGLPNTLVETTFVQEWIGVDYL